jgi:hypothetical protein
MRVAAAMRKAADAPAWIEDGKLNLVLPSPDSEIARPACIDGPAYALGRGGGLQRVAHAARCPQGDAHGSFDHVVMPPGFAPVDEIGAWLLAADPGGPVAVRGGGGAMLSTIAADAGETLVAKADASLLVEPIRGLEPYEPEPERQHEAAAADDGESWVTTVQAASADLAVGLDRGFWAWLASAMAFATAAGLIRLRFAHTWPERNVAGALQAAVSTIRTSGRRAKSPKRTYSNAGAAVAALLDQTETVVAGLKAAGPLREVLQSEIANVGDRLESIEKAAAADPLVAARSGPQFRGLVRELERIRRIALSAAASLSRSRGASSLPRTVSEAYDVLGVNPDVSEDVLKRIVDALRMSWHPDLARRDEDRREREDRIRQINAAWELITAKREAA